MPTIIECPSCHRKLRIPNELEDREVRCPSCGQGFSSREAPVPSAGMGDAVPMLENIRGVDPPAGGPGSSGAASHAMGGAPASGRRRCPCCGEFIRVDTQWCRFCGEDVTAFDRRAPWERGEVRRDGEPHRASTVLGLGIAGLLASFMYCPFVGMPLSIAAWIMGHRDLRMMREGIMDSTGEGQTKAGMVCGIIGSTIVGFGALVAFLFFGLIGLAF